VVASVFPLADVAKHIGGNSVDVTVLLPPGQTPHGYNLSPGQTESLTDADLLIVVGLGVDHWAEQTFRFMPATGLRILKLADITPSEKGNTTDPHLWLDPVIMMDFTQRIAEVLAEIDPVNKDNYLSRSGEYIDELERLDESYRQALAVVKGKALVTVHPAFSHIAERYGLRQEAIYSHDVQDHGPKNLEEVADFIRNHDVKVIFSEPQFPDDRIAAIASQTGCVVRVLDPLGHPGAPGRDSYLALMRWNLQQLKEGEIE